MWAIEQIEACALAEDRTVLLQELPTKMVRHVIRSVTWANVDIDAQALRARRKDWRQFYYLTNGARIVLLRKFRRMIVRLLR
jgi:hypothetical protein